MSARLSRVTPDAADPAQAEVHASFSTFFLDEYHGLVAVAAMTSGDAALAEDLVQDAMAVTHERWSEVAAYAGPWTRRAVVNRALSRRRRAGVESRALAKLRGSASVAFPGEPHDHLWRAVADLPPRQRAVVSLRYFLGNDNSEIADALDCSESTVRSHLQAAHTNLRRTLGEDDS